MAGISQWRTALSVLSLFAILLIALVVCAAAPDTFGLAAYETTAWAVVLTAAALTGKSAVQHLGAGGGLRGAVAALVEPSPPPPAEGPR